MVVALKVERDFSRHDEQLGVGTPAQREAFVRVMARRHITSEPSTSNIGLRAPAAGVAAVATRLNGERSRWLKHAGGLIDLPAGEHHCPPIGLARMLPRGWSCRLFWICARRSGEALMSVQRSPSSEMARLASVRVRTHFSPAPAIRHPLQLQFLRNAATRRAPSWMPVRPIEL